jgi:hypothetical protein
MVMIPVTGFAVLFCPVNTGTAVFPFAANPIDGVLLLHVYEVPVPESTTCAEGVELQIT